MLRLALLKDAGSARGEAFLLSFLLTDVEILKESDPGTGIKDEKIGTKHDQQQPGMADETLDQSGMGLVRELIRRQTHRGRELRRLGEWEHPGLFPRESVNPTWWHWRNVFGAPWRNAEEHINVLEARAFLAGLQWRFRAGRNIGSRGMHLADSSVVIGAVAKGRSRSQRLGHTVGKSILSC